MLKQLVYVPFPSMPRYSLLTKSLVAIGKKTQTSQRSWYVVLLKPCDDRHIDSLVITRDFGMSTGSPTG